MFEWSKKHKNKLVDLHRPDFSISNLRDLLNARAFLSQRKLDSVKLAGGAPTICYILEMKSWNWIKSFASTESHTFSRVTGHFYISLWLKHFLRDTLKGVTPLVWHPCDTIFGGFWTGVLTVFFVFRRHIPNILAFHASSMSL